MLAMIKLSARTTGANGRRIKIHLLTTAGARVARDLHATRRCVARSPDEVHLSDGNMSLHTKRRLEWTPLPQRERA